ncbi:MAG: HEAT repeat domain-containing protein [Myxococcota bacterium]
MLTRISALLACLALEGAAQADPSDRAQLLPILLDLAKPDPTARATAATKAGATHHPLFLDPLKSLLSAREPSVRAAAATALGELGVPRSTTDLGALVSALLAATKDAEPDVALAAVQAVARYPFPEVRERLMAMAKDSRSLYVVREAAGAALEDNGPETRKRLDSWLELSAKEASVLRGKAPKPSRLGTEDHLLIAAHDLLDLSSTSIRQHALEAIDGPVDDESSLALLAFAAQIDDPIIRSRATYLLARQASPAATVALETLLSDREQSVRAAALQGLSTRDDPSLIPAYVARLQVEPSAEVRATLKRILKHQIASLVVQQIRAVHEGFDERFVRDAREILGSGAKSEPRTLTRWLRAVTDPGLSRELMGELRDLPRPARDALMIEALFGVAPEGTEAAELLGPVRREERRPYVALLEPPLDSSTVDLLRAAVARGDADPAFVPPLTAAAEADDATAASLVELFNAKRGNVRSFAVAATMKARGPRVADAAAAILTENPSDDAAFNLLLAQADEDRRFRLAKLLEDPRNKPRAPLILSALGTAVDPHLAEIAAGLALENPTLLGPTMELLAHQRPAVAVPLLAEIAHRSGAPESVRAQAVTEIGKVASSSEAVTRLRPLANDSALDVKLAARDALHQLQPLMFPEWDPYGRYPLVAESAGFGAAMLLIASDIADARLSPAFTAGAGLVLGAATPFLLTQREEISLGDAGYFGTVALWGTLGGWGLGGGLGLDDRGTRVLTLVGEGVGLTLGAVTLAQAEWGLKDAALANVTSAEVMAMAASLTSLTASQSFLAAGGSKSIGFIAGALTTVPMALFARKLEVRDDLALIFTLMGHGAWLGALAPGTFGKRTDGDLLLGAVVGQGFGFLSGLLLAQATDVPDRALLASGLGSLLGSATLGGLGLSLSGASPELRQGLTGAGAAAFALGFGLLGDHLHFDDNDAWIIGLSTTLGAVAGARLDVHIARDDLKAEPFAGNVLLGMGLGAVGGLALSQIFDASGAEIGGTTGGGALFALSGAGLGAMIPDLSPEARSAMVGAGFLTGALLSAPLASRLSLTEGKLGYAAITSLSLGALLSPTPLYYHPGTVPGGEVGGAVLLGSSLGLAGGILLSQALSPDGGDIAMAGGTTALGATMGVGLGLLIPGVDRGPAAGLAQGFGLLGFGLATAAIAARDHRAPGLLQGQGVPAALLLSAQGGLAGALIPGIWRDGAIPGQEPAGGALLGASLGLGGGLLASALLDRPVATEDVLEAAVWTGVGDTLGLGLGLLTQDRRTLSIAIEGLGTAGLALGLALAPRTHFALSAYPTIALHSGLLTALGAATAFAAGGSEGTEPVIGGSSPPAGLQSLRSLRTAGGALLGTGTGVLLGAIYAETVDRRSDVEVAAFAAAASAIGVGAATVSGFDDRGTAGFLAALGAGGFALGLGLTPFTSYSPSDVGFTAALMSLRAVHGAFAPRALGLGTDVKLAGAGAAVGGGVGLLSGLLLSQVLEVEPLDGAAAIAMSEALGAVAGGLAWSIPGSNDAQRVASYELAELGGLALAGWLGPELSLSSRDWSLLAMTTAAGALHGSFLPTILGATEQSARAGGVLFGTGLGFLGGLALAQALELEPLDQVEAAFFLGAGDAIGGGLGLLLPRDDRAAAALFELGGLSALGAGLFLAERTSYSASDPSLIGLSTALGAWHGAWAGRLAAGSGPSDRMIGGGALLGAGLGFLGGAALASATDLEPLDQAELGLMWAYGTAVGAGLGVLSQTPQNTGFALLEGGGILALSAGLMSASSTSYSTGDVAFIGLASALGAWTGSTLPVLFGAPEATLTEQRGGGALLGAGSFALAAHLASQWLDYRPIDVATIGSFALLGNAMGAGLGLMIPNSDSRTRLALADGFGLGATALMLSLAPSLKLEARDLLTYGLFLSMGTAIGGVTPAYWHGDTLGNAPGAEIGGGMMLGGGLGLAAGALLSNTLELSNDRRASIALGAAMGGLSGAGLGLALSPDDRLATGLFQGLMLAGSAIVGATVEAPEVSLKNLALGSTLVGYLTWHELGVSLLAEGTNRQAIGATMATIGLGSVVGTYLVPKLQLSGEHTLMLLAGAVWGSWIGGWSGAMVKDGLKDLSGQRSTGLLLLSSVLGSDLGVALTSAVVGGLLNVEPTRFAIINVAGLGGMMIGMLSAGFAKAEPLKAGNVIGSLSGLALGAIITSFFDFSPEPSPYDKSGVSAKDDEVPSNYRGPMAQPLSIRQWFPTTQVEPGPNGESRYIFGVQGLWD